MMAGHASDADVSGWHDIVAISAGRSHIVGLCSDGSVVATGEKAYGQCNVIGWKLKLNDNP